LGSLARERAKDIASYVNFAVLNGMQPREVELMASSEEASYAQVHAAAILDIVTMWWNCHFNHHLLRDMITLGGHLHLC
jgi:hypothetical protein